MLMETKKCSKCGKDKSLSCFSRNKSKSNGRDSRCKACMKEYCSKWYNKNKDRNAASSERWRKANREKANESNRKWTAANKEKHRETVKNHYRAKAKDNFYLEVLSYAEELRSVNGMLEARCAYCGRWFAPTNGQCKKRQDALNGSHAGEHRLYCSEGCKKSCPIYRRVKHYKGRSIARSSREVDPALRKMALSRDNYTCQSCEDMGEGVQLHVHHIKPVVDDPIEEFDIDNVVTLCKPCHILVHSRKGCSYVELRECNQQVYAQ